MTNQSKSDSDSARKPLTADRLRELVRYDPDTGLMTSRVDRHRVRIGDPIGTLQNSEHGRLICRIKYRIYYVHRLAWLYVTGAWPTLLVDHVNGNPLDNRWSNLREATYAQNSANQGLMKRNTSGAKNVTWFKSESVWRVMIKAAGREHFIGRFHDKAEAIKARDVALVRLHGEFARLD